MSGRRGLTGTAGLVVGGLVLCAGGVAAGVAIAHRGDAPEAGGPATSPSAPASPGEAGAPLSGTSRAYGSDADLSDIDDLLEARAEAILADDRDAFLATVDDADPAFVRAQGVVFDNLQLLGVDNVVYGVSDHLLPVSEVSGDDRELTPAVVEHVRLDTVDSATASYPVQWTFVDRDGTWLLGAERFDEAERTLSAVGSSRPWGEGPIAVRRSGPVTAVVDEGRAGLLPGLCRRANAANTYVHDALGLEDDGQVLIDATTTGTQTRLSYDGGGVAGAVFGPVITTALTDVSNSPEPVGIAGWRVKYNPERLDAALGEPRLLRHELTHFAMRGTPQPLWMLEGLASYLEWERTPMSRLVVPDRVFERLRTAAPRDALLDDAGFTRDPTVGYLTSQALVEELAARKGLSGVLDLADAYGRALRGSGSSQEAQTEALRRVYDVDERAVARAAYDRLLSLQHF